jgi:hypothetical protein
VGLSTLLNRQFVLTEVSLVVADAARRDHAIDLPIQAKLIRKHHPNCGLTEEEVASELAARAEKRGLRTDR